MDSRQRDIVIKMKLHFKELVKLAVLKRSSLIGTIVKTFIGLMKDTVVDIKIMKENKKVKCDLCYDNIYH